MPETIREHNHVFWFDGKYEYSYVDVSVASLADLQVLQAEVAELKNKLEQITIETNE